MPLFEMNSWPSIVVKEWAQWKQKDTLNSQQWWEMSKDNDNCLRCIRPLNCSGQIQVGRRMSAHIQNATARVQDPPFSPPGIIHGLDKGPAALATASRCPAQHLLNSAHEGLSVSFSDSGSKLCHSWASREYCSSASCSSNTLALEGEGRGIS